ncbi:hypothetical protein [Pararhizobium gei]|uniref:hypothetical protein n=1 Tax=Pararhizobium gei TaxID=1395951 RepID=UPI0023DA0254|nr:hypothetical protein [Rhizobium gei]
MASTEKTMKFGIDARTHKLVIGSWRLPLPQSKWLRILVGCVLIFFGCLGFLPILGFWMVPLGLLVLSHDLAMVRRWRRRIAVWWARRRQTS